MRADLFLVEHGFATTRSQAQRLIASGAQWRVEEGAWKQVAKGTCTTIKTPKGMGSLQAIKS